MTSLSIFVTGGSGYMGKPLVRQLLARGHSIRALVRPGSENKLPAGCDVVLGDALDSTSYAHQISRSHTFIQLVGVAHPSPSKAAQFQAIDRASALGAVDAAKAAAVKHFVYLSVAHPAPVMKSYIAVREECEAALLASGMNVTVLRPWYVLGPGHRWPYLLVPMYWLLERIPATHESARRLGLVTLEQMVRTLVWAVENPSVGARFVDVPQIRNAKLTTENTRNSASSA